MLIRPENSAPSQRKPAQSIGFFCPFLKEKEVQSVADIGCGRLRNAIGLLDEFREVFFVDTELQCKRVKPLFQEYRRKGVQLLSAEKFYDSDIVVDAVLIISVFHTIPSIAIRYGIIREAAKHIRTHGYMCIDVPKSERYYRQHCTKEREYSDGWVMGNKKTKTFYKPYTAHEFDDFIACVSGFEEIAKKYIPKHVIRVYQKTHEVSVDL